MHVTIMYNRSGIWTSRLRNTEFLSVFVINKHFSVKPHAKIFGFLVKIWKSLKKLYMPIMCNRSMIWASRSIEMKFHSAFAINLRFTLKMKVNTFIFWAKIWFFYIRTKWCTWLLCITNLDYGLHGREIRVSVSFCHKLVFYCKTEG
jgi:hypothetical protein